MDVFSREKRSEVMSKIRSRWTKPEIILHNHLKGAKIRHEMHPALPGSPDIALKDAKVAIFVDGCFWHKCPKCYREPSSNREYWLPKIEANVRRDRRNSLALKRSGYAVIRLWEHEIRKYPRSCTDRICSIL